MSFRIRCSILKLLLSKVRALGRRASCCQVAVAWLCCLLLELPPTPVTQIELAAAILVQGFRRALTVFPRERCSEQCE